MNSQDSYVCQQEMDDLLLKYVPLHYKVLGIQENATETEIKRRYFDLQRFFHPDKCNLQGATEISKNINTAYETLGDKEKRIQYDKLLVSMRRLAKITSKIAYVIEASILFAKFYVVYKMINWGFSAVGSVVSLLW